MDLARPKEIAIVIFICTFLYKVQGSHRRQVLASILNESIYDSSISPDYDKDVPTNITVQLSIRDMHSVSETYMEYSVDTLLRQWWKDDRLNYEHLNSTEEKLELDTKSINKVWEPDLYFTNEKRAHLHTVTTSNRLMHIYSNGTVVYSMRLALTLSCTMHLEFYPFDSQTCPVIIQSFGYTNSNININWRHIKPVSFRKLEMPQFDLNEEEVKLSDYASYNPETGSFSVVRAELRMNRKVGYYLLQIIIPSILLVALSWVSFWVDVQAVAPRVSLGVTCVLTMTTQTSGIRMTLPPVSYVKAIDIWMFVCLLFVFAALLEYAYVNTISRRNAKKQKSEDIEEIDESRKNSRTEGKWSQLFQTLLGAGKGKRSNVAARADKISRLAFPGTFILFTVIFLCVCFFHHS